MRKIVFFIASLFFIACDDGDVELLSFNFEPNVESCKGKSGYVFYILNKEKTETLAVELNTSKDFLTGEQQATKFVVNASSKDRITYRTFDAALNEQNYFCNEIPPFHPKITADWKGTGIVTAATTKVRDDNDDVASATEDRNGNGNYDDDDTDNDGNPDYLDVDDDGDNVATKNEDINGDKNLTNDDTDGDGIPNYLDNDDDGDGIPTRNEDANRNGNPADDKTDNDDIPDYLDTDTKEHTEIPETLVIKNVISTIYTLRISIQDLVLTNGNNKIIYDHYKFQDIKTYK